jgi:hypothetical protein
MMHSVRRTARIADLAVARDRFVAPSFASKLCGLPAYYAGQLLLAWSISGSGSGP